MIFFRVAFSAWFEWTQEGSDVSSVDRALIDAMLSAITGKKCDLSEIYLERASKGFGANYFHSMVYLAFAERRRAPHASRNMMLANRMVVSGKKRLFWDAIPPLHNVHVNPPLQQKLSDHMVRERHDEPGTMPASISSSASISASASASGSTSAVRSQNTKIAEGDIVMHPGGAASKADSFLVRATSPLVSFIRANMAYLRRVGWNGKLVEEVTATMDGSLSGKWYVFKGDQLRIILAKLEENDEDYGAEPDPETDASTVSVSGTGIDEAGARHALPVGLKVSLENGIALRAIIDDGAKGDIKVRVDFVAWVRELPPTKAIPDTIREMVGYADADAGWDASSVVSAASAASSATGHNPIAEEHDEHDEHDEPRDALPPSAPEAAAHSDDSEAATFFRGLMRGGDDRKL